MACLKHWAFNEQETNRMNESSVVDERTAWELYYPPFEAGVNAGAGSVMCSYNRVNGTHACGNEELLRRDLKQRMGFRGFVMTDWWALHHPAEQSVVRGSGYGNCLVLAVRPTCMGLFCAKWKSRNLATSKATELGRCIRTRPIVSCLPLIRCSSSTHPVALLEKTASRQFSQISVARKGRAWPCVLWLNP